MTVVKATILETNKAARLIDVTATEPLHKEQEEEEVELNRKLEFNSSNGYPESGGASSNPRPNLSPSAGSFGRRNSTANQRKRRSSAAITGDGGVFCNSMEEGGKHASTPLQPAASASWCTAAADEATEGGGKKKRSLDGITCFTPPSPTPLNGQRLPPSPASNSKSMHLYYVRDCKKKSYVAQY